MITSAALSPDDEPSPLTTAIEWLAFVIVLAIVVARCTMLETIRDPLEMSPGADAAPHGPGATTALVFSLLSIVPALLLLVRAAVDRSYVFTRSWGLFGLLLLGGWTFVSALWAADKFMAAVSGVNWLSAMTLAWSAAQLVRTPLRARIVAGVGLGLLLIYLVHSGFYLRDDLPALREMVEKDRDKILADRGWAADSFEARQFFQKITAGEMVGFSASPNTFAACIVVTMLLTAGLALQRLRDGDGPAWAVLLGLPIVGGAAIIVMTHSRTALAALVLAMVLLVAIWRIGSWMSRHARGLFVIAAASVLAGAAVIVWRGTTTGTLFHDSLTFRWRYWLGAWRIFTEHPVAGVGWENFGPFYLAKRLAIASEEVRDPHNFIVRFFVELGLIGGTLAVASIALLLWRITRPAATPASVGEVAPTADNDVDKPSLACVVATPLAIGASAMLLNTMATIDWAQSADYVDLELRKRLLYAVLITGSVLAATIGVRDGRRDISWIRNTIVVATLLFLLQNLVDFSMFEPGGMALFALLAGSGMGLASIDAPQTTIGSRRWRIAALASTSVAWLIAMIALAVPIGSAESNAATADELRRTRQPGAADYYATAAESVPYNADYAFAAARSLLEERHPIADFRRWIDRAIAANPLAVRSWLMSARVEAQSPSPDLARLRKGYDEALRLDPQSPEVEMEYADVLERLGYAKEAAAHLRRALAVDAAFDPREPKRLKPERVAEIESKIKLLDP